MTNDEFAIELSKVQQVLGAVDDVTLRHLRETYLLKPLPLFQKICSLVLERCKSRPKPAHFKEAYDSALRDFQDEEPKGCDKCKGERFTIVYFRVKHTGLVYQSLAPCPKCNPLHLRSRVDGSEMEDITEEEYLKSRNVPFGLQPPDEPSRQPAPGKRMNDTRHISVPLGKIKQLRIRPSP